MFPAASLMLQAPVQYTTGCVLYVQNQGYREIMQGYVAGYR